MRLKKIILICALFALLSWSSPPMSKRDRALEGIFFTLLIVDWGQTRSIVRDDDFKELNFILGPEPNLEAVDLYFLSCALSHLLITRALPEKYRPYWQMVYIGIEANQVFQNYQMGIRVEL